MQLNKKSALALPLTLAIALLSGCNDGDKDVSPYGELYVQGLDGNWTNVDNNNENAMAYTGSGIYQFSTTVTNEQLDNGDSPALAEGFRLADQALTGTTDFGLCSINDAIKIGEPIALCADTQLNIPLHLVRAGRYTLNLDGSDKSQPTLTISYNRPTDFIRGADVSTLAEVERLGGKCFENGEQEDCLVILKRHGFNYIRLRLWNDPYDDNGVAYGGGIGDLATVTELAQRAKALGYKFLLDFHYSDFWADPGKQFKPKAWEQLSFDQLATTVNDYTKEVLVSLKDAGVEPDMVQIGNEINSGMLWPDAKSWGGDGHEFEYLAAILNAGISAVREIDGNTTQIMLHLAEGGKNSTFRWWFDGITQNGVSDFDVIGMSYYPYWHGTLDALQYNMEDMITRYGKDIAIAETAYGFTTDNGDSLGNNFGPKEEQTAGYTASVEGQAHFLTDLMDRVSALPEHRGLGIFYWEPTWLPVGVTWASNEGMDYIATEGDTGDAWENQALFDFDGNALESLTVFE